MLDEFPYTLKRLNLKITPKRVAILEILMKEPFYLSPEQIWKKMKKRFIKIGLPTVYRNLEELSERKVISKVTHPDRQLYYYLCQNQSHHHHFICLSCRRVEDINLCGARDAEREVERKIGGKVLSHIMQVNGLCKKCLKNQSEA
jgi:Fur family transcriptional regulator, ferric uptake regulator